MIYLQLWIGDEIPEHFYNWMKGIQTFVTENDKYLLISEKNFFDNKISWIDINNYNFLFDNITTILPVQSKVDLIRTYLASKIEDIFYMDTDIELLEKPNFENNGKPYICQIEAIKERDTLDSCIFYNGKNLDFFEDLLERSLNLLNNYKSNIPIRYCWQLRILNRFFVNKVNIIDFKYYKHHTDKLCR